MERNSELTLTIISTVAGVLMIGAGVWLASRGGDSCGMASTLLGIGAGLIGIPAAGYSVSRGVKKAGEAQADK